MRTPHLLVFEPDPRGHAAEWIGHILAGTFEWSGDFDITLAVPAELAERLRPVLPGNARVAVLSPLEQRRCNHPSLLVSAFSRWSTMRRYLRRTNATDGLFLAFDHLTLPFALGLGAAGRRVSGILFRPTAHYAAIGCLRPNLRERMRDWRKEILTRLTLRNRAVDTMFSLDPYFAAYGADRYGAGDKLFTLVDPAFAPPEPSPEEAAIADDIPAGRITFLMFGEITERKGILPLLRALAELPEPIARSAAVVVAGRVDPAIAASVTQLGEAVTEARPGLWLKRIDRWLAAGEIAALVERSDVVLAPYQRFVGSSGVLLWAARAGRPVLCQDYGLIGRLTRHCALGASVDTGDPRALAAAIEGMVLGRAEGLGDPQKMADFVASRTPEAFAATILERWCGMRALSADSVLSRPVMAAFADDPNWSQQSPA